MQQPKTGTSDSAASTTTPSSPNWITVWGETAGAVESTLTAIALVVGAIWTYFLFVKGRLRYPRANIEHRVDHWQVGDRLFIRVAVRVSNPGGVLVRLDSMLVRVQQLLPLPEEVEREVAEDRDPVQAGETEVLWPELRGDPLGVHSVGESH